MYICCVPLLQISFADLLEEFPQHQGLVQQLESGQEHLASFSSRLRTWHQLGLSSSPQRPFPSGLSGFNEAGFDANRPVPASVPQKQICNCNDTEILGSNGLRILTGLGSPKKVPARVQCREESNGDDPIESNFVDLSLQGSGPGGGAGFPPATERVVIVGSGRECGVGTDIGSEAKSGSQIVQVELQLLDWGEDDSAATSRDSVETGGGGYIRDNLEGGGGRNGFVLAAVPSANGNGHWHGGSTAVAKEKGRLIFATFCAVPALSDLAERLEKAEEKFQQALDLVPEPIFSKDAQVDFKDTNLQGCQDKA
jgi:hypothetical protein